MLLLLFEVTPRDGHVDEYLQTAAQLRPALDAMGGCLFIDRYRSRTRPRTILSLQLWRDEASLTRWRVDPAHHKAQALGRARVFEDYRLRVAEVVRIESLDQAAWQAERRSAWTDPATTAPRHVAVADSGSPTLAGASESFESIYRPAEFVHVVPWLPPSPAPTLAALPGAHRLHIAEIARDYGMHDRGEAPQYFAPIPAPRAAS